MLNPARLSCELRTDPRGIDATRPRLGWVVESPERGQRQSAYQILVAGQQADLAPGRADLWDSGRVESDATFAIPYGGGPLVSGQGYVWTVRAWDQAGQVSDWAPPAFWQMGLLHASDWHGEWVGAGAARGVEVDGLILPPPALLNKTFPLTEMPVRATVSATARGVYELTLNGARVGDAVLAPGWTDYSKRIAYQTYDVTPLLRVGENALDALVGDGWYSGYVGFDKQRGHYGPRPELLLQLDLEYGDGRRESVVTDDSWRATTGPVVYADLLMGEKYDARLAPTAWQPVEVSGPAAGGVALVAQQDPPVRVTQDLTPQAVTEPTPGTFLFDMGQNMVGWVRLTVEASAGTEIRLRFAEMLSPDGTLYTTNLRAARQTDTYVCAGGGVEAWEPRFTFHGFRYVEVTGWPGTPTRGAITGRVVHSDTPPAGTFACSDAMVNQLQRNILWGQRGNFLSIPTDCPQRDERLGWMGDAQIFVRTATCNMDVAAFFEKWMQDVMDAQSAAGGFPDIAPHPAGMSFVRNTGAPAWGDAGVIVPWTIFLVYGDAEILRRCYPAMARWMKYLDDANPSGLWEHQRGNDYGDWLSIDADTPKEVLATAYFAYDASLMARIARVLGRDEDAAGYEVLFEKVRATFNAHFVSDNGRIHGDTQTCYVLALRFGLLPEGLRPRAARHLVDDIAAKGGHLSTGFVGVGYLCPVLTESGYNDVAYRLLLNDTFPSWGYSIRQGATTIWERWDGWTEGKGFQDPGMNSFNHYSLGSVGEWLHRYVAGIDTDPDTPGFAHVRIHPRPGPGLTHARAEYDSVRGKIVSGWHHEDGRLTLDVTIPANAMATVSVPAPPHATVTEGGRPLDGAEGVTPLRRDDRAVTCRVGSGTYRFEVAP
jgi:alpha-L-rhamnosidase